MELRPAKTIDGARWAVDALHEQHRQADDPWTTLRFAPDGFDAYGRIFHAPRLMDPDVAAEEERLERESLRLSPGPVSADISMRVARLEDRSPSRRTWAAVAQSNGRRAHPLMQWSAISAGERHADAFDYGWEMEREEVAAVTEALATHTGADEICTFLIWEGYNLGELSALGAPRIKFDHERYYVLEGPLESVLSLEWRWRAAEPWPTTYTPPNLWWPTSKEWCLSFGIDDDCTYAGGSEALIASLVNHPRLEACAISRTDNLGQDPINDWEPRVRISIVFDPEFGANCTVPAAQSHSAWIVDSPVNRERLAAARSLGEVTMFAESSPRDLIALIDEHHGENAAGPTWNEIELIGTKLSPEIETELANLGVSRIEATSFGFCGFR